MEVKNQPIKLAFIITGLSIGGAEMMLLKVLARIDRQRFSPHIISLTTLGEIGPLIQVFEIPVEVLGMRSGVLNPLLFFRLIQRLKKLNADVVHTWMYHADLLGGLASLFAGVAAVAWGIRNSNLDRDKTKITTRVVVGICAMISRWIPDRILCCSEVARQVHVDFGYAADKMVVIPNGFDLSHFKPDETACTQVRSELGVSQDTPLVGLIGRFDSQKNHVGFFKAAGQLHRRLPSVHFVLAGKGIDGNNDKLRQAMQRSRVKSVTHLLGLRSDIPCLMAALDVLVSSSSYGEAFPNVLGEAMASGVPCVVTDVGDSAYIVGDTGRVVKSGDMAGLAKEIESLLLLTEDERRALGNRARARVAEFFEIGLVVKRYEEFYNELIAKWLRRQ